MTNTQVEALAYDLICFLKKWGLWRKMELYCLSTKRVFCDTVPDFHSSALSAGHMGFRQLGDVYVASIDQERWDDSAFQEPDLDEPVLVLECDDSQLYELVYEKNPTIRLSQLSCTIREYVLKHAIEESDELSFLRLDLEERPILDDTEFDSYDAYLEMELELEDELMELEDECRCGELVADRIIREFDALLERHGVFWDSPYGVLSLSEMRFYEIGRKE